MKKLLSILALLSLLSLEKLSAQTTTIVAATTGTNVVLTAPYHLLSISAFAANAQTISFYDSGTTNLFYTNAAYITRTSYTTNVTNINTATTTGIPQTNIYSGIWTYSVTNAASTNTLPIIATILLGANVPVDVQVNDYLIRGLACVNTTNATIVVTTKPSIGR
jgi:hypothetical protein